MHIKLGPIPQREKWNELKQLVKRYGKRRADRINRRLADLQAAPTLETMRALFTGRCHELMGDRKGQLALDLEHPYRLIFEVDHDPVPSKVDGGLDWSAVTAVIIIEVVDYHG
jgi:toxin HigB-1